MRRIAIVNQKGGVGKTTTTANLGAALARRGKRVLCVDLDPQGNLTMHLGIDLGPGDPSTYGLLIGTHDVQAAVRPTTVPGLQLLPANIDLSGAEMELAGAIGREQLLRDALDTWETELGDQRPDYVLFDCPPSLGLLSINGLVAADEVFVALQTEFFALQGMSQLMEVVRLIQRRLNSGLQVTGIVPCLYDSRLRLAREVLTEIRKYFPEQAFRGTIGTNVKLAEAPSYGQTIFEYAPESRGARDYLRLADEVLGRVEAREAPAPADPESEPAHELTPQPAANTQPRASQPEPAARPIVRAEDLPPAPAEVFPIGKPSPAESEAGH